MYRYYQQLKQYLRPQILHKKQLQKESSLYSHNKTQVLQHYRYLLKHVPKIYSRKLQQRTAYIEICHLFHQSKVLSSLDETLERTKHLRQLVVEIKKGEHSVLGSMVPGRTGEYDYLKGFFYDFRYRLQ